MDGLIAYGGIIIAIAIFAIQYTFDDLQKGISFIDASNNYKQDDGVYWQLRLLGVFYIQRARRREIPDYAPRSYFALQLFTASFWAGSYGCFAYLKSLTGDFALELINGAAAGVFALFVILTWWRQGKAHVFYQIAESVKKESLFRRKFGLDIELMMLLVLTGVFLGIVLAWHFTQWSLLPGGMLLLISSFWRIRIENQLGKQHKIEGE